MKTRNRILVALCGGVLALGISACGDDDEDETGGDTPSGLSGKIQIDGSSTVAPLSEVAAELFQEANPDVEVGVGTSGTGGGFEKFCAGETDISDASRVIAPEEEKLCEEGGVEYEEVQVANDALTVVINPENPVTCLSVEQLASIWGPDASIESWSEIDDLDAEFSEDLQLFGPGTDSGTFDYFTEAINGEEGVQTKDYNNVGEDDNATVTGVSGSPGGMGYFGFSFFEENADTLKALEVDGGEGCVAPALETVQDGSYQPLARGLYIYPSGEALQDEVVQEFVRFYIENQEEVTTAAGFIPMTEEQTTESQDKVESLAGA
ncbi:MAG: phosphate ABC transporter substrate-binding protein PstS family protein [Actinomycetota bacterium]|nr:phosphate ABC transporter substrate-binding protein PstS family protein [Actinomycetota bacterium]